MKEYCPRGQRRNRKTRICEPYTETTPKYRRCPNGQRRDKFGDCKPFTKKPKKFERCPKGERKNRKTRKCEPYTEPSSRASRCPNGTRMNKRTKKCEPKNKTNKKSSSDDLLIKLKERKEWLEKLIEKEKNKNKKIYSVYFDNRNYKVILVKYNGDIPMV